jgi:GNAT superfamily N-acetyltransferase
VLEEVPNRRLKNRIILSIVDNYLQRLIDDPSAVTLRVAELGYILRPIIANDCKMLYSFLSNLSATTRKNYVLDSYDEAQAKSFVDAIGKWQKLRIIMVPLNAAEEIIGLLEVSFSFPEGAELTRFESYGVPTDESKSLRFGPVVADKFQGKDIAKYLVQCLELVAKFFERNQIILWGGVYSENARARKFYEKHGFVEIGRFQDVHGQECIDMAKTLHFS